MQLVIEAVDPEGETAHIEFGDVANPEPGGIPGLAQYMAVEREYLSFFERFAGIDGAGPVIVSSPTLNMPAPSWVNDFRNASPVSVQQSRKLLRSMFRGCPIGCEFEFPRLDCRIGVGFDGRLVVDILNDRLDLVAGILSKSLRVALEQDSPVVQIETRKAVDEFWGETLRTVGEIGHPLFVVERWAYGNWGENWYLVNPEDLSGVRSSMSPGSLVQVFSEVAMETCRLSDYFDSSNYRALDRLDLRFMPSEHCGARLNVRPLSSLVIDSETALLDSEILLIPSVYSMPQPICAAVVPEADGRVRARWVC